MPETPPQPKERKPWERLPKEPPTAYRGYCLFRDLGPERTLQAAWELYYGRPEAEARRQAKGKSNRPGSTPGYWNKWSSHWAWVGRCASYDDYAEEQARLQVEASAKRIRAEELAENERQAKSRLATVRVGRETASRLLLKIAKELAPNGKLENLNAEGLIPHLAKIATLLDKCLTHERYEERRADPNESLPSAEIPIEQMTDEEILERIRFAFSTRAARVAGLPDRGGTTLAASEE